jgi:hypothetical protein
MAYSIALIPYSSDGNNRGFFLLSAAEPGEYAWYTTPVQIPLTHSLTLTHPSHAPGQILKASRKAFGSALPPTSSGTPISRLRVACEGACPLADAGAFQFFNLTATRLLGRSLACSTRFLLGAPRTGDGNSVSYLMYSTTEIHTGGGAQAISRQPRDGWREGIHSPP